MTGFQHDIAGGQGNLVTKSLQSPNFQTGVQGWQVAKDGSAEFNNVTIRGGVVLNGDQFWYNGPPGTGNLIASIANSNGTDPHGNPYLIGFVVYSATQAIQVYNGNIAFWSWSGAAWQANTVQITMEGIQSGGAGGILNLGGTSWVIPSGDASGAVDAANLQVALDNFHEVWLLAAVYMTDGPISVPNKASLQSGMHAMGVPIGNYGAGGLPIAGAIIKPTATFAGATVLTMASPTVQGGGQQIRGITIDGSGLPAGNTVDGISASGFVAGVTIRDVLVYDVGGYGLHTFVANGVPDFWDIAHSKFSGCGSGGVLLNSLADSYIIACEATGNTGQGWQIVNSNNTRLVACKAEGNTKSGWSLVGNTGFTGDVYFNGCTSSVNAVAGFNASGAGTGTWYLDGCVALDSAPWFYAGSMNVKSNAAWSTSTAAPTLS